MEQPDLGALFENLSPEMLAQLQSAAASMLGGQPSAAPPPKPPAPDLGGLPEQMQLLQTISKVMQAMQQEDDRTALLQALKPLLSDRRRDRVEDAIRLLRLLRVLPLLTGNGGGLFGNG